jgi:hypothetical protein
MRRILAAPLASLALALVAPGVAVAAHHGRHHRHGSSHSSSRHRHGKRAHLLRFGSASTAASQVVTAPTTLGENAGTVESFEGGVLTIKLADGSLVKGKVTEDTDLRCVPATPPSGTAGDDDQGDGGDQGSWSSGDRAHESDFQASDGTGQDQDDDDGAQEGCTTELLKNEAVVREAELELGGAGAVWERIVLVH